MIAFLFGRAAFLGEEDVPVKNTFVHYEDPRVTCPHVSRTWGCPRDKGMRTDSMSTMSIDASRIRFAQSCDKEDKSHQSQIRHFGRGCGRASELCANEIERAETPAGTAAAREETAIAALETVADADIWQPGRTPCVSLLQSLPAPRKPNVQQKKGKLQNQHPSASAWKILLEETEWTSGVAWDIAFGSEEGSLGVQAALKGSRPDVQSRIIGDFIGNVVEAVSSPHAIHVLAFILKNFPEESGIFVAKELAGLGCQAAGHKYACHLLCCMVQESWKEDASTSLIGEVLAETERMWWHVPYATYVFQELLEHGTSDQQRRIVDGLLDSITQPEVVQAITQPNTEAQQASIFVLVKALTKCADLAARLAGILVGNASLVRGLASRKFGCVLLRALLSCDVPVRIQLGVALRHGQVNRSDLMANIAQPCKECKDCKNSCSRCPVAADAVERLKAVLALWE